MTSIPNDYVERVYAGWLGKVIGVRHGGNIEQWTYDRIARTFGEITGYLHAFRNFAADDDTNGPMFFLRALEDYTHTSDITAEQMGLTWLNYAPDGHGFYWWGGYGKSTEHTAYQNLKNGIMAPRSGSIAQNGAAVAEQIGGQIFIDTWGLIAPGNPALAAEYAEKIASVSHDGNGKYGGMFIAACIAAAFVHKDIHEILEAGLSVIPADCAYAQMTRAVMEYHAGQPEQWRDAFRFVESRYGYHLYPGECHIIPNASVIILSLLYGEGDFSRAINICNMCGWDTDCNVANVGTIMGVMNGLDGIDASWRQPINDFLCCSSVIGTLNMLNIPWCATYIASLGYKIAGSEVPERWAAILSGEAAQFHFELPGSTHAFRTDSDDNGVHVTSFVQNSDELAASGLRSLKVVYDRTMGGYGYRVYHKTYYRPHDFNDSRYDPSFSPLIYPGQSITASLMVPDYIGAPIKARLYVKDGHANVRHYGESVLLAKGEWTSLTYELPYMANVCLEEAGIELVPLEGWHDNLIAYVDHMHFSGIPNYSVDFKHERTERWHGLHQEVSQFTYLRGLWALENGELSGSYSGEPAECYTGDLKWHNYEYEAVITPQAGGHHNMQFRVQGGIRSYAVGLAPGNRLKLYKNANGYKELAAADFEWAYGQDYTIKVAAQENRFSISVGGQQLLQVEDTDGPYLTGQVGFSNLHGSHTHYKQFSVRGL
ncbi:ADP-ribosylglycohydrolase family protein [Paenibacillus lignilyticus]|uniref:ADP-ribosylglycohydrolase family protein n=1 Tax=Paenibacillus lignilyticus TaxID=1172615 RepID=A0ABS5CCJ0_9BACL|nr:ADP-ribosylglycohydrolase family protein [Paenibacillus lignilyticus]MBP3961624.1 ADP-ribosylglycohydrolase family protein [Paenibacillus lignilyticus]MBP3963706.1 ADP-ribosylglycohydrolase family protein [Paenibacillus lignilyticus]